MSKQTAVDWLIEQLKEYDFSELKDTENYIIKIPAWVLTEKQEKSKSMEKEQIEMHEEVISILNTKVLEYEEKLRFIPVEENLPKYYGDPFYILVKNKNNEPNLVYIEEHSDIEDIRGCFTHWRSFL